MKQRSETRSGRPPKFTRKLFEQILENIFDGHTIQEAARRAGIHPGNLYRNPAKHPELRPRLEAATFGRDQIHKLLEIEAAERELYRRAVEGVEIPVMRRGKICGYRRRYSDRCLIFLLKRRKPEVYAADESRIRRTRRWTWKNL